MGFVSLLKVASMPVLEVLIICTVGAFMATDYLNLLPSDARRYMNKVVFVAFTPSLVFANLAKTVRLQDIISWWFMPVNIGVTFLVGGFFGWVAAKILRPEPYIKDLIMAFCSSGNLGNILMIVIPAICKETGSPFGDESTCTSVGLSYVSFSMALGAFYIWTCTFHFIRSAGENYKSGIAAEESKKNPSKDLEGNYSSPLLLEGDFTQKQTVELKSEAKWWTRLVANLHQLGEELLSPPILGAAIGLVFGAVAWLRNLIIGENAPLRVINSSIKLLGDGTIPCINLILGANLTQGLRKAKLRRVVVIAVICVRYVILPVVGIGVVQAAWRLGFLPTDPLYRFVLMVQFTLPPAMAMSTMTQLFGVAEEECSVLFLWTYLVAALALTAWSTVFMWILT